MANIIEEVLGKFVELIEGGGLIIPPKADTLGNFNPPTDKLLRDEHGLVVQGSLADPKNWDGGDSAHKTGIIAFCNSHRDQQVLHKLEENGIMRRHPSQAPWNNYRNCSRDQLIAYAGGCWRAGKHDIVGRLLQQHAERMPPFTCQNTEDDWPGTAKHPPIGDPLLPHDIMYLRICAGQSHAFLDLTGQFLLQASIELLELGNTTEKNQAILQAIVCGRLDLFTRAHPKWRDDVAGYWSGWREQSQIADALIWVIEKELMRYEGIASIPMLFPIHLLQFLKNLDLKAELLTIDPRRHADLAGRFLAACVKDAQRYGEEMYRFVVQAAEKVKKALEEVGDTIEKGMQDVVNAIERGANECAKALTVAVVRPVEELVDALLGRADKRYHDEVVSLLNQLNQKLDEVLTLLERMPGEIAVRVEQVLLRRDLDAAREQFVTVRSDLTIAGMNDTKAAHLADHVDELRKMVIPVVRANPLYYLLGIEFVSVLIAAYGKILRYDPGYHSKLVTVAEALLPTFKDLVDETKSGSFKSELKRLTHDVAVALPLYDDFQKKRAGGQTEFMVYWFGVVDTWVPWYATATESQGTFVVSGLMHGNEINDTRAHVPAAAPYPIYDCVPVDQRRDHVSNVSAEHYRSRAQNWINTMVKNATIGVKLRDQYAHMVAQCEHTIAALEHLIAPKDIQALVARAPAALMPSEYRVA